MKQKTTLSSIFKSISLTAALFTLSLLLISGKSFSQTNCNAHFQFSANLHNPDSVHFFPANPASTIATYSWSFGDGTTSTNQDPWHLYPNAGTYYVCLTVNLSNGTTCTWCDSVHVVSPPPPVCNAHFQFNTNPHNPDSLHFYPAFPASTIATYSWSFGDGTTSTSQDPWHLYPNAGAYYVCLTVNLSNGTTCTWCDSVHVVSPPPPVCNAHFQFNTNPHNPDSLHFYPVNPASNIATYSWSFGDGTTSTSQDPWHLYPNAGANYVCLTVNLSNGTTCTWCDSVHVISPPPPVCNAHFQFSINPNNSGSLHFYPANPASTIATYSWSFGDGTTSTNQDPWHLYPNAGAYYVCLTVNLPNGTTCTWCDSVHVVNPPPPVCHAQFQFNANPHNPDSIHFFPIHPASSIAGYSWSFGDGSTSNNIAPWHLYAQAGTYYVCLTVTLANNTTCTWCDSVHVISPPPPICNAHFNFNVNPHNPDSLHFFPANPASNIATYLWSFGDGTTSTNQDPWHLYPQAGTYNVCLTVTNANGSTCTWCDSIHVMNTPPPVCNAHFQFFANPHNPDSLHFFPNNLASSIGNYFWSFGDGITSVNHDPWHLYSQPGVYYVCLTVTQANGNTCTYCDSVHVPNPPPACNAQFHFFANQQNTNNIHFFPISPFSNIGTYLWTFGDGSTSTNRDPWHLYSQAGTYNVCLTVTFPGGVTCTSCNNVQVVSPPPPVCHAQFQSNPNPHNPDSVHFFPVYPTSTIAMYSWSFGDGTTSTNHDPWHYYAIPGMYYTCLTVSMSNGVTCTWCDSILGRMASPNQGQVDLNSPVVNVFPNPVNTSLTVSIQDIADPSIDIYDLTGSRIYRSALSGNASAINTSDIHEGVYYYIVRSGDVSVSQGRIVIIH